MARDYLDMTIDEVYEIITQGIDIWPLDFEEEDKLEFMDSMIEYFEKKEEYEKCATIQRLERQLEHSGSADWELHRFK